MSMISLRILSLTYHDSFVYHRSDFRKKYEEQQMQSWQDQEKERERRQRLRALRLDPAWSQVRGADQALEDIEHRRCYKEVVERERLLQYYMDRDEMMARVWQMPPLFERQVPFFIDSITDQSTYCRLVGGRVLTCKFFYISFVS